MSRYLLENADQTRELAEKFASELKGGEIIMFTGGLGSGKTTFTAFLASALGCPETVTSPTFVIMNRYCGRLTVYHFDMYRISDFDSLYSIGYFDVAGLSGTVTLSEWSENVREFLPPPDYLIEITRGESENERIFNIIRKGEKA